MAAGSSPNTQIATQLRRRMQQSPHVYEPSMVSLGPYHHGKPELSRAEEFKYLCLDWFASGDEGKKGDFYKKILERIDGIRYSYSEVSIVENYDNKALARMILLDACFIITFMEIHTGKCDNIDWINLLGVAATRSFMLRDVMVLENQVPFHVIKLLISLKYAKEEAEELLLKFVNLIAGRDENQVKIPGENEPIHILEACWRVIAEKATNQQVDNQPRSWLLRVFLARRKEIGKNVPYTCRSVTDLKAKGIHFRPSSRSGMDITFTSHAFYGQLQLPVRYVSDTTIVFYSNLIAFEVVATINTDFPVLSYANFMKSLIESTADVKELQDKGILFNKFANLKQVVKVFKEIDTFGIVVFDSFKDVRQRIGMHCGSKSKTWIADLIHTRFRSPWTVIALVAATMLLVLAFLQTYFTIHPVK